jgi:hypothetical protein
LFSTQYKKIGGIIGQIWNPCGIPFPEIPISAILISEKSKGVWFTSLGDLTWNDPAKGLSGNSAQFAFQCSCHHSQKITWPTLSAGRIHHCEITLTSWLSWNELDSSQCYL